MCALVMAEQLLDLNCDCFVLFIWCQTCDDYIYSWHFLNVVFGGSDIAVCFIYALSTCGQYVTVPVWWIHLGLVTEELTLICCIFSLDKYCFNLIVLSNFLWTGVSCYLSIFLFNHMCMQKLLQVYHSLCLSCEYIIVCHLCVVVCHLFSQILLLCTTLDTNVLLIVSDIEHLLLIWSIANVAWIALY